MRREDQEIKAKCLVKKQLAEAVDFTDKGKKVVFYFEQSFKDGDPSLLQSLYFRGNEAGEITVPISLQVEIIMFDFVLLYSTCLTCIC